MTLAEFNARLAAIRALLVAKGHGEYARPTITINAWGRGVQFEPCIAIGNGQYPVFPPGYIPRDWTAEAALSWLEAEAEALPRRHNPADYAPYSTVTQEPAP